MEIVVDNIMKASTICKIKGKQAPEKAVKL
jgi:hypothetical protein